MIAMRKTVSFISNDIPAILLFCMFRRQLSRSMYRHIIVPIVDCNELY